jgi:CubicO group peptidase (beta-lactamase class C family)
MVTRLIYLACSGALISLLAGGRLSAQQWQQYEDPVQAGFSVAALDSARLYADSVGSGAVMVLHRGRVVAAWGDVERKFRLASIRKSLVSALYGIAAARGKIDLDLSLAQLGINDRQPLTPTERSARIRDLIAARSGIYLPAAYAGSDQDAERPARGSHAPGSHWFYNNWDFNVAGVVYEKLTDEELYDSFLRRIARPVGMQDYTVSDGLKVLEPSGSIHPAHTFRMSTRDLARFGQLYLQQGKWTGREVVPANWIRESTTPVTKFPDGSGYAYMWWTYAADSTVPRWKRMRRHDLYQARGTGGQVVFVMPEDEMVIVLRGDTDNGRGVGGAASWEIANRIMLAKRAEPVSSPRLIALTPTPFRTQSPRPAEPRIVKLARSQMESVTGSYDIGAKEPARVFLHDGRLFGNFPGLGEAELYALSPTQFTLLVETGFTITFDTDASGSITGMTTTMPGRTIKGARIAGN